MCRIQEIIDPETGAKISEKTFDGFHEWKAFGLGIVEDMSREASSSVVELFLFSMRIGWMMMEAIQSSVVRNSEELQSVLLGWSEMFGLNVNQTCVSALVDSFNRLSKEKEKPGRKPS